MPFSARVLLDSVSPAGVRLTTMEVRYPRFIHSELMTHRVFCLDADTQLYFDLPSAGGQTRRFAMTIAEFHEKWHVGARPRPGKKRQARIDGIDADRLYDSHQAALALGYSHYTTVNANFRRTSMPRTRGADGRNRYRGSDLIAYAQGSTEHRYSLRSRLSKMRLRSCNEETRAIYHTTVGDVTFSGCQPVYRVTTADGKTITASAEHRFLTEDGWLSLREAADLQLSTRGIASWRKPLRLAVNGTDALSDPEWLQAMRDRGLSASMIANELGVSLHAVKRRFRRYKIRATNPGAVWRNAHTKAPWNKGRVYSMLRLRGVPGKAKVRRGAESHLWRGGITPERKLIGAWTMRQAFRIHRSNAFRCRLCGDPRELHTHHLDPVARNPARAYDVSNLTTLCSECHGELHHRNIELALLSHVEAGKTLESFWASVGDARLPRPFQTRKKRTEAHFVDVIAIDYVGIRPTYDIEVSGPYANFVADGFIVHNSRNAASSRAIPIRKMIDAVREEPAMPLWWGRNQTGMQAREEISDAARGQAETEWRRALDDALRHAEKLASSEINLHKQLVNRILEPFAWITVILSATEWANFFTQRTHEDAQPELKHIAELMLRAYRGSEPRALALGEWHTPLIQPDEEVSVPLEERLKISVARSARVSYLTHTGSRDLAKDLELYEKLLGGGANGHWSPFEHVATPLASADAWSGNFRGWEQYRKRFAQEHASTFPDEVPVPTGR
jgi:thymidylate synthase ThyX